MLMRTGSPMRLNWVSSVTMPALQARLVTDVERRDRLGVHLGSARPWAVERGRQRWREHVGVLLVAAHLVSRGLGTVRRLGPARLGGGLRRDGPLPVRPRTALFGGAGGSPR